MKWFSPAALQLTGHHKDDVFMFPLNDDTRARAENLFRLLSKGETVAPMTLRTQGRYAQWDTPCLCVPHTQHLL